ncbi:MAG: hypothetical protein WD844_04205 [Thermoleophilaceae bacterium]
MADAAQTPELALRYLGELSTDIQAVVILDRAGALAAATEDDEGRAGRMRELVTELFEHAGESACQVEVTTTEGGVFAVREHGWTIAVVTGRFALPSLTFFDLRSVLSDLERRAA